MRNIYNLHIRNMSSKIYPKIALTRPRQMGQIRRSQHKMVVDLRSEQEKLAKTQFAAERSVRNEGWD